MNPDPNPILDALEDMCRQHCFTNPVATLYKGESQVDITDSGALSANALALRVLAEHGRFRIVREYGRMVAGYWPENDPKITGICLSQTHFYEKTQ